MKRAPADVVEALAGHGATADHPVEATDLDLEPVALVRRLGRETRTAARSADGTANVLGGEVARVSIPFGRTLIDNGRAVPCDEACVMLDGCGRPAWTRGLAVLTAADAATITSGQDMHAPAPVLRAGRHPDPRRPRRAPRRPRHRVPLRRAPRGCHRPPVRPRRRTPRQEHRARQVRRPLARHAARLTPDPVEGGELAPPPPSTPRAAPPVVGSSIRPRSRGGRHRGRVCGVEPQTRPHLLAHASVANRRTAHDYWRMVDKLPDVWASRDFPVLREVARRIDAGDPMPAVTDVAADTGLAVEEVQRAAEALKRRGLVDYLDGWGGGPLNFRELSGEAYLVTGLHPNGDEVVSQLMSAIDQAVEQIDDPAEKPRLRALRDAVGGVSRDVLSGVIAAVITSQTGMSA